MVSGSPRPTVEPMRFVGKQQRHHSRCAPTMSPVLNFMVVGYGVAADFRDPAAHRVVVLAERRVVHTLGDAQYSLHQDTFHQVVKLWVYPANLTAADGALQVAPQAHAAPP